MGGGDSVSLPQSCDLREQYESHPCCKRRPWLRGAENPEVEEAQVCLRRWGQEDKAMQRGDRVQRGTLVGLG